MTLIGVPAPDGAGHGGKHELEDRLLPKGVGYDLQAPALLEEQAHEEICRAGCSTIVRSKRGAIQIKTKNFQGLIFGGLEFGAFLRFP